MRLRYFRIDGVQCDWGYSPAQYSISFATLHNVEEIKQYYRDNPPDDAYHISDLFYFDTAEERDQFAILFMLKWGH